MTTTIPTTTTGTPPPTAGKNEKVKNTRIITFPKEKRRMSAAFIQPLAVIPRSARSWDVRMPPFKKQMVGGRLVPTVRRFFSPKQRRITIEIKRPTEHVKKASASSSSSSLDDASGIGADALRDNEVIVLSILRMVSKETTSKKDNNTDDDGDDAGYCTEYSEGPVIPVEDVEWKLRWQYKLEDISILKLDGKVCEVKLGSGNDLVVRDIKFKSDEDALAFQDVLKTMGELEKERALRQASVFKEHESGSRRFYSRGPRLSTQKNSAKLNEQQKEFQDVTTISLLVEIVSAKDLPVTDLSATDAYVIVRMGGKEIHRTDFISRSADPIWTLDHGSLFLLEMSPEEFFSCSGGMSFTVKDYDALGSNPILGNVNIPLHALLEGKGDRNSYPLDNSMISTRKFQKFESTGKLYLRFKRASESDIEFMNVFKDNKKKAEVYLSETYLPLRYPKSKILRGQKKKGKDGGTLFRVKPFPDPKREGGTKWMTEQEIELESRKPSTHWVEAGSGNLFKVYFELIGCDGLPNMDAATLNFVDRTDCFGSIAFEDSLVNTDIISNSLSPRWMPWCYRAFAFNVSHPSSDILLALFDYDPETSPAQMLSRAASDLHDRIGRVRINIAKFLPDTTYNLTYPIFLGGEVDKHRKKDLGRVHVRLRIECKNARKVMIAGLRPPSPSYLAVARKVDFEVSRYTVDGASKGLDKFSMPRFIGYIDELQSYQMAQEYIIKAALVVWLWRGHYRVQFREKEYLLPLHSMVAYVWGILVTWNYNLLFSFLFFGMGWAMLASNEMMKNHPSKWHQSRRYLSFLRLLLLNSTSSEKIEVNENVDAIEAYSEEAEIGLERWRRRKQHNKEAKKMLRSELRDQMCEAKEDINITTAKGGLLKGGVNVNPLNSVLFPIQKRLRRAVVFMRVIKSIFLWDETYYAFWVTTFAFIASFLAFFIPWGFLLRWTLRVAVWVLLGPWMTVIDRYYFRSVLGSGQDSEEWNRRWKRRYNKINRKAKKKRIRKERALKLKAMMRFCFGKFLVSIPRFNEELFRDNPLPQSSAAPYDRASEGSIHIAEKKFGQKLSGDMVMMRQMQVTAEAKKKAKKKKKWRRRRRSGSTNSDGGEDLSDDGTVDTAEMTPDKPRANRRNRPPTQVDTDSDDGSAIVSVVRRRNRSRDGPRKIWRKRSRSEEILPVRPMAEEKVPLLVPQDSCEKDHVEEKPPKEDPSKPADRADVAASATIAAVLTAGPGNSGPGNGGPAESSDDDSSELSSLSEGGGVSSTPRGGWEPVGETRKFLSAR